MTGVDWTQRYPWIVEGAAVLPADHAVIDAEGVVTDDTGITIFDLMVERIHDARAFV